MTKTRVSKASGLLLAMIGGLSACGGGDGSSTSQSSAKPGVKLAPDVWIKCADEWGTCTVSGTTQVRYGLNGTFVTRNVTGSVGCNNDVFGDPLPGADKVCEYATITAEPGPAPSPAPAPAPAPSPSPAPAPAPAPSPAPAPAPTPAPTWSKCADEWQTCSFSGTQQVRYGLNGTWATRTATGSIGCNNDVFGDPLPGADKICEVASAPAPSPAPAPAPSPSPTPAPSPSPSPAPAPAPSPSPTDCNAIIDQCFDLTAPKVTTYRGDKSAAASYTFDDGYPSSGTIATIFENRGLRATFYIVPGTIDDSGWNFWKGLLNKGHEIGNHSMTHTIDMGDSSLSDQVLKTEITDAQNLLAQRLGVRPRTFAFPWHSYTAKALQVAESTHFAVRKMHTGEGNYEFAFFDQAHSGTLAEQLATVNGQLQNVVDQGGWFVAGGHGVDGDGWSPVTSKFLQDHLNYASQFSSRLWIDTYQNVARYRVCRPQIVVTASTASSTQAQVQLGGSFSASLCTAPVTVSLPVKTPLNGTVTARKADGTVVPVTRTATKMFFDARPGETVTVEVAK